MAAPRILALDVGTQSARALVFDTQGHVLAKSQHVFDPTYVSPQPGWAEQDPENYWRGLVDCCTRLWSEGVVAPGEITGMSLTTQRATTICVDAGGNVLRPAMLWLDQRRCTAPPPMGALLDGVFRLAGAADLMHHLQAQAEANWLAQHEPDVWRQTARFLFLSGWLLHRMSGDYVDSHASQVGYVPFDYKRHRWEPASNFKWKAIALKPSQLPRLVAPGERIGGLQPAAAAALGLPPGVPIIASAADKACEVLGCGVLEPDIAQLSFGTTATINTSQEKYVEVQRLLPAYPSAMPDHYNTEIQIFRGFWMVSWFKREFAHREDALARERGVATESLFDDMIRSVPPGSMGLTLQPYWTPGVRDPGPEGKGAIVGFGDVHTRAHLYRAMIEGLAYGLRAGKEQIEKRIGRRIGLLRVSGGGSQSDTAMQIAADVFGLPAQRPEIIETSALGAAMNCAVGLGLHADYAAAAHAMCRIGSRFEPDAQAHRTYDALYREVYQPLYPRLRPLYRRIRAITGYPP